MLPTDGRNESHCSSDKFHRWLRLPTFRSALHATATPIAVNLNTTYTYSVMSGERIHGCLHDMNDTWRAPTVHECLGQLAVPEWNLEQWLEHECDIAPDHRRLANR
jgi:hypothetical protein